MVFTNRWWSVLDRARVLIGSAIKTRRGTCPRESRRIRCQNETQARTCNSKLEKDGRTDRDVQLMRANGKEKERNARKSKAGMQLPSVN